MRLVTAGYTLAILVVALGASGCGRGTPRQTSLQRALDPLTIMPSKDIGARIKTGTASVRPVNSALRVAARVEADETRIARVSTPVTGRLIELRAYEGETVRQGQILGSVFSTDLSNAQTAFLKAHTARRLADRAVARARQLLAAGVIGEAELQRREAELQQAGADFASAREQLVVLGLTKEAIDHIETTRAVNSTTHLVASIDGIVLERKATLGQMVQAAEAVFTIADLSSVWLVADVPEPSAGALTGGKPVQAEIPALPGESIHGRLSFVSAVVDRETRTVRTRMNLPNPQRRYKPAMLATLTLMDGAEPKCVVPLAAVVRESNFDHVFVQTGPNTFQLRRVSLGDEYGDLRVVLDGLKPGDKIVTSGAFHLNNERNRLLLQSSEGA